MEVFENMKNTKTVTLWLSKELVRKSREKALQEGKTFDEHVNDALRKWLKERVLEKNKTDFK